MGYLQLRACSLSAVRNRECPLVGGCLYIIAIVLSIGAMAIVRYREGIRWWEGPLWEVLLYTIHVRQVIDRSQDILTRHVPPATLEAIFLGS